MVVHSVQYNGVRRHILYLSAMGKSEPVVLLYPLRMASEICSSLACSTAFSLFWGPWPRNFSWTKSTPGQDGQYGADGRRRLGAHPCQAYLRRIMSFGLMAGIVPRGHIPSFFSLWRPPPRAPWMFSMSPPPLPLEVWVEALSLLPFKKSMVVVDDIVSQTFLEGALIVTRRTMTQEHQ